MGDILFLAHRVPFPPDRGDKIRSHHLLKGLARLGPVHVGAFAETETDLAQKGALAEIAKTHALIERKKPLPLAGIQAVLANKPVSLSAFDHEAMRRYVQKTLGNHRIDTIFVFSGQMGNTSLTAFMVMSWSIYATSIAPSLKPTPRWVGENGSTAERHGCWRARRLASPIARNVCF